MMGLFRLHVEIGVFISSAILAFAHEALDVLACFHRVVMCLQLPVVCISCSIHGSLTFYARSPLDLSVHPTTPWSGARMLR